MILPVIYIAGKYRAPTPWQVQANIRAAQEAALQVWKLGAVALCPHSNTGLFDGECDDSVWLAGDKELLRRSDAVLLIDGWRESQGARAEMQLAGELGLPVFEVLPRLKRWVDEWKLAQVEQ
jgi:Domain of unknown function (DUF4406)